MIRICVCSILPTLYKAKQPDNQLEMVVDMYDELCKSSETSVRKAAISTIPEFIKVMEVSNWNVNDIF